MEAERIIFSFLKARGYRTTEQSLKSEIKNVHKQDISQNPPMPICEQAMTELFKAIHDANDDNIYLDTYRSLVDWIDNILDTYQQDLQKILGPVFVFMYLHMIRRGMLESASGFFEEFSDCYSSKSELKELKGIQKEADLYSEFVQNLLANKYVVLMSKYSISLLMCFIENSMLSLLLYIINQHLDLQVSSDSQSTLPVLLGDDVATLHDTSNLILNPSIEDVKVFKDLRVPFPAPDPDLQENIENELANKTELDENHLPNIICHSSVNASDTLLCLESSYDGTLIAGGFEDSSIRI